VNITGPRGKPAFEEVRQAITDEPRAKEAAIVALDFGSIKVFCFVSSLLYCSCTYPKLMDSAPQGYRQQLNPDCPATLSTTVRIQHCGPHTVVVVAADGTAHLVVCCLPSAAPMGPPHHTFLSSVLCQVPPPWDRRIAHSCRPSFAQCRPHGTAASRILVVRPLPSAAPIMGPPHRVQPASGADTLPPPSLQGGGSMCLLRGGCRLLGEKKGDHAVWRPAPGSPPRLWGGEPHPLRVLGSKGAHTQVEHAPAGKRKNGSQELGQGLHPQHSANLILAPTRPPCAQRKTQGRSGCPVSVPRPAMLTCYMAGSSLLAPFPPPVACAPLFRSPKSPLN